MTKLELNTFKKQWAIASQDKKLNASHHMMYNILRGYSPERGFTPTTKHTKLQNGHAINGGLAEARKQLANVVFMANKYTQHNVAWVDRFLAPFEGSITVEQLADLRVPFVELIEPNYGIGVKVATKIIEDNLKELTFDDIAAMLVDLAA